MKISTKWESDSDGTEILEDKNEADNEWDLHVEAKVSWCHQSKRYFVLKELHKR